MKLHGLIAEGQYSSVFVGTHGDSDLVAIKCYPREHVMSDPDIARSVLRERDVLAAVSVYPLIVGYRFSYMDCANLYIGTEYVSGGDLFAVTRHGLTSEHAIVYSGEVVLALAHLHSFDIIHRDVKPENVLIAFDGHIRLTDFGSAWPMSGRFCSVSLRGTPEYMAPEILIGNPACETSDFWSLGCLVCELLTGRTPFACDNQDMQSLVRRIINDPIILPVHPQIGTVESDFIEELLVRHPTDRLGARPFGPSAILQHPFFRNHTQENFLTQLSTVPSQMTLSTWNGWDTFEELWGVHVSDVVPDSACDTVADTPSHACDGVTSSPDSIFDTPISSGPSPWWSAGDRETTSSGFKRSSTDAFQMLSLSPVADTQKKKNI